MQQPSPFRGANWQRPALALLALVLGLFSFYWAQQHPEYPWDGAIILAVAAAILVFLLRRRPLSDDMPAPVDTGTIEAAPPTTRWWQDASTQWRLWLIGVSVFLTIVLLANLLTNTQPTYLPHFLAWLGAIAAFTIAVAPPRTLPTFEWRLWWDVNRNTAIAVVLIVVAAFALRAWDLEHIPWTLGGDEGSQGLEAIKILNGEIRNPFTTGWLGVPTMSFFFNTITIGPMGNTVTALRLPWVFIGVATVLVMFWLVTRLFGVKLGLVSAALLGAYHYHIHFSRLGSNQVADPFFIILTLFFLYKGKDSDSPFNFAMAGVTVGVAQYFYAGARLTMIMLGAVLVYFIWLERSRPENLKKAIRFALIATGAFLISSAPMLQYAVRFPNDYNARINEVGIFQHGWVDRQLEARPDASVITLLWEQFQKAFLMFNYYPDTTVWYGSPRPAMDGLWSVLFMVGLLYCTVRVFTPKSEPRFFPFVVWWWTGMVLGGVLTENPPSYQRMITLAPPAVFFVSYVLYRVVMVIQNALPRREENGRKVPIPFAVPALAIVVAVMSFLSIRFYFTEFIPLNPYGSRNGEIATGMAKFMMAEMQDDQVPVFLGPPLMYLGFGSIPYLEPRSTQGFNVDNQITSAADVAALPVPQGKRPLFFSVPGRAFELDFVEQAYPGGERRQMNDTKGQLLYWVYAP